MCSNKIMILAIMASIAILVGCVSNIPVSKNSLGMMNQTPNMTTYKGYNFTFIDINASPSQSKPGAQVIRLWAEYMPQTGFTVFKYIDDTGMVREFVRDSVFAVEAGEDDLPEMTAVYDCGSDSNVPLACKADANSMGTMPCIGITVEEITATGSFGRVMIAGLLENVDTSAWDEGNILYVSNTTAGGITNIKPRTPALSQEVGVVLVKSATDGKIKVFTKSVTGNEYGTVNDFVVEGNITANNFHSGLYGIKTYYVSDVPSGPATRKLTFTNGILTGET